MTVTNHPEITIKKLELIDIKNPVLHQPAHQVNLNEIPTLFNTFIEMHQLMFDLKGIGLAAPQVGIGKTFFVMNTNITPYTIINPVILGVSDRKIGMPEGCLSYPNLEITVHRPDAVRLAWFDENGTAQSGEFSGMEARVILHEYDHLLGVCFTDRVSKLSLEMARKRWSKKFSKKK